MPLAETIIAFACVSCKIVEKCAKIVFFLSENFLRPNPTRAKYLVCHPQVIDNIILLYFTSMKEIENVECRNQIFGSIVDYDVCTRGE